MTGFPALLSRASSIVYAWVITIPASAIVAALAYWAVALVAR
jgi:PiT family inorganic phosphate transporter